MLACSGLMPVRALRLEAPGQARIVEQALPADTAEEVVLHVLAAAICRTDARMWQSGHRDLVLPRVLGHELCVRGEDGRRYAVWPGASCGRCQACRSGAENLCRAVAVLGFHRDGGIAQRVRVPRSSLVPVPGEVPDAVVCLAEPLGCGVNALNQAGVEAGERVLIHGGGPVGLLLALAARARGAQPLVVEVDAEKAALSSRFQSLSGVVVTREEPGYGWDVAINATSSSHALCAGLQRLRSGGRYVVFSGLRQEAGRNDLSRLNEVHYRQLHLVGAFGCTHASVTEAVDLLAGYRKAAGALIEAVISLEESPDALRRVGQGGVLRFVVRPEGAGYQA